MTKNIYNLFKIAAGITFSYQSNVSFHIQIMTLSTKSDDGGGGGCVRIARGGYMHSIPEKSSSGVSYYCARNQLLNTFCFVIST